MVHSAFNVQPIRYQDEFPSLELDLTNPWKILNEPDGKKILEFVTNQYLIKSKDWSYENEFRTLAHDHNPQDFNTLLKIIPAKYISSVILGAKLKDNDPNKSQLIKSVEYFNLVHNQNVKIYHAILKPDSFKITVPEHPILDKETRTLFNFFE